MRLKNFFFFLLQTLVLVFGKILQKNTRKNKNYMYISIKTKEVKQLFARTKMLHVFSSVAKILCRWNPTK